MSNRAFYKNMRGLDEVMACLIESLHVGNALDWGWRGAYSDVHDPYGQWSMGLGV